MKQPFGQTGERGVRSYADLDDFNRMIATCETIAHLEVLAVRGRAAVLEDPDGSLSSLV